MVPIKIHFDPSNLCHCLFQKYMVEKQKTIDCLEAVKHTVKSTVNHALTWHTPRGTQFISNEPLG